MSFNFGTEPYPYQKGGVKRLERLYGRALLADDMGLGKTLQTLLYVKRNEVRTSPTIIVCPAGLKWNWEKEALTHIRMRTEVLETRKVPRSTRGFHHNRIIINYDILKDWLPFLMELKPRLIILDECHYLQSRTTLRTKAVKHLCQDVPHVIAISGTPLTNRPAELWPILNILWPEDFPSFFSFATRYCKPHKAPWGWTFNGATHLTELHAKLFHLGMIRRLKEDVMQDLPEKTNIVIPLNISDPKQYKAAHTDFLSWLRKYRPAKIKSAMRAESLVKVGYLKSLAARLKLEGIISWVDDFLQDSDEKILLWTIHHEMVDCLQDQYDKVCLVIDGRVPVNKRDKIREQFLNDPRKRILIGNIKANGTGGSYPGVTTEGFCEMGWTPGEHKQAIDRLHGIGRGNKNKKLSIYWFVGKGTIEEKICELIQKKQKTLDKVLDNGVGMDEITLFDDLLEALENE